MTLGEKILKLRKDKGMSQEDLAKALNVSRQSISKWENDSALPDVYNLKEIARVFNVSLDELMSIEVAKENKEIETKKPNSIIIGIILIGFSIILFLFSTQRAHGHHSQNGLNILLILAILALVFGLILTIRSYLKRKEG